MDLCDTSYTRLGKTAVNSDLNFNIRDVEFSLYSLNLFKVTSSSNGAISTAFIAISNSYDEISTWIV